MVDNRNKKRIFKILTILILVVLLTGVTYSFFQYDKIGGSNILRTGGLQFSSSYSTVTLQNVYPIPAYLVDTDLNNVMEVTVNVSGKTLYSEGMEYAISFTDINAFVNTKEVPISAKMTASGLGTYDSDYLLNRGGNDKLYYNMDGVGESDKPIFVGYIPSSNTTTSGAVTFKIYLDDATVGVSDTYDGTENKNMATSNEWGRDKVVLTNEEWNTLRTKGITFKIKIEAYEGIWYKKEIPLSTFITQKLSTQASYVKSYTTEYLNSNPTYKTQDTVGENPNKQEVFYYTGADAITNGNVLFAGYCWQIVRTTDTGGVKLIYNGIAYNNQCTNARSSLSMKMLYGEDIASINVTSPYLYGESFDYDLNTNKFSLVKPESTTRTWSKNSYNDFAGKYTCLNTTGTNCDNVYYFGSSIVGAGADTNARMVRYKILGLNNYRHIGITSYNVSYTNLSGVGYMYNKMYAIIWGVIDTDGDIFGKNVEYRNGNYLVIDDTSGVASNNGTIDRYHHYSCGGVGQTICSTVRYYYLINNSDYYYIELTNGEKIQDALKNMLNYKQNGDTVDANINVKNSSIKDYLELWYDKKLKNYEGYLDTDAVYCNNRAVALLVGWDPTEDCVGALRFQSQLVDGTYLNCDNLTDRFSKANEKAKLKNPIGILTDQERKLMGDTYAATGERYWQMTPKYSYENAEVMYIAGADGSQVGQFPDRSEGVRPVIVLSANTKIEGGSGTATSPYQIGPLVTQTTVW